MQISFTCTLLGLEKEVNFFGLQAAFLARPNTITTAAAHNFSTSVIPNLESVEKPCRPNLWAGKN
jgi:hypothetical protein